MTAFGILATTIELPIAWMLSTLGILATTIAALAGIIYKSLQARLDAQDKIIDHFRQDVARLSKGCGFDGCHWRDR